MEPLLNVDCELIMTDESPIYNFQRARNSTRFVTSGSSTRTRFMSAAMSTRISSGVYFCGGINFSGLPQFFKG
jgi:hypothetical protein